MVIGKRISKEGFITLIVCSNADFNDSVDLLKIYFASKLQSKLTKKAQMVFKNIIGGGLIIFGVLMFFKTM